MKDKFRKIIKIFSFAYLLNSCNDYKVEIIELYENNLNRISVSQYYVSEIIINNHEKPFFLKIVIPAKEKMVFKKEPYYNNNLNVFYIDYMKVKYNLEILNVEEKNQKIYISLRLGYNKNEELEELFKKFNTNNKDNIKTIFNKIIHNSSFYYIYNNNIINIPYTNDTHFYVFYKEKDDRVIVRMCNMSPHAGANVTFVPINTGK